MHGLCTMPVTVTEVYVANEIRCWGIAHTFNYYTFTEPLSYYKERKGSNSDLDRILPTRIKRLEK
jgi:hypothetical protein